MNAHANVHVHVTKDFEYEFGRLEIRDCCAEIGQVTSVVVLSLNLELHRVEGVG